MLYIFTITHHATILATKTLQKYSAVLADARVLQLASCLLTDSVIAIAVVTMMMTLNPNLRIAIDHSNWMRHSLYVPALDA